MNDSFNLVCVDLYSKESNKVFFFKICIYALVPSIWEIVYLLHAKYYVQIFKNIKTSRNIYLKNKLHSCTFIRKSQDRTFKVRKCKVIIIKMTYSVFTFVAEVKHHSPHVHLFKKYWRTT